MNKSTTGFPFHINLMSDKKELTPSQKIGLNDCFKHGLVNNFLVMKNGDEDDIEDSDSDTNDDNKEKSGEIPLVSKIRFTVVILKSGVSVLSDISATSLQKCKTRIKEEDIVKDLVLENKNLTF